MISYFFSKDQQVYVVEHRHPFTDNQIGRLNWLFNAPPSAQPQEKICGYFVGSRAEMVSPWSTNAVEITADMGIEGIARIELLKKVEGPNAPYDPMLEQLYQNPGSHVFTLKEDITPEPIQTITDIAAYNEREGLALSHEEIVFLEDLSKRLGRPLTDSELFGFSQVNSEHCRHKIFNASFILDGEEQENSLFQMIKATSKVNYNELVSAYSDNVAFVKGPTISQFSPEHPEEPSFFHEKNVSSVLSLKAETHNFPTTVEPFNGAATGTGGEIRDRMAGGKGSIPVAGTAVYMTSYHGAQETLPPGAPQRRNWLYRTPQEILTKASNGASDFGNKFGQPIIAGSLLTFEHQEPQAPYRYGYDKVIMLAGGIGYAKTTDAQKEKVTAGKTVVMMGGDNYRIGMGGGAVSSVNTGRYSAGIELNAVQRANPEMQKRVQNVVRALAESDHNPIISIHDHGAGGHLNCLTELIEATGGNIHIDALPIGDQSLSDREIISNESQERMGLLIDEKDYDAIAKIADRERAPIYKVGETNDSQKLVFGRKGQQPAIDLAVEDMLGKPPKTVMIDERVEHHFANPSFDANDPLRYLKGVLSLDSVASKDWLTNKVDRSVTGRIARQQTVGSLQLPLADCGAIALDYKGCSGMATAIGHAPRAGLSSAEAGSELSIAEALTNIVFAPLKKGLSSVSLSANWMWPCKNKGEDERLYRAVAAASRLAIDLGINIPTGKDSLSMTQKYPDGEQILSPGTVIISAAGEVSDIKKIVDPALKPLVASHLLYIDFSFMPFSLGGSAFYQSLGAIGDTAPGVADPEYFIDAFNAVQDLIRQGLVVAGHDISDGGMLVAMLEMCFPEKGLTIDADLRDLSADTLCHLLYAENPAVLLQINDLKKAEGILQKAQIAFRTIGTIKEGEHLTIQTKDHKITCSIDEMRNAWYENSFIMDCYQTPKPLAQERKENLGKYPITYKIPYSFTGKAPQRKSNSTIKAGVLRDKGSNGDRELAYALFLAGFEVKDIHVTDLITGRETLDDIQMIAFCGGFSRSDVLGSAKGWAAAIKYSPKASEAIRRFYERKDTLSIGICNGCQLMALLGVIYPDFKVRHTMEHNHSGKLESIFTEVTIPENNSVMLSSLSGSKLGVWCVHGEGRFSFDEDNNKYQVVARYSHDTYPLNPNGSPEGIAAICSSDGRHLTIMPHPERAIMPWQCGYYPFDRQQDEVTPWMDAFRNAFVWCEENAQ